MVDEKLITEAAKKEFKLREHLNILSMLNIAGLSYEEREQQDIEYRLATAYWLEAKKVLDDAVFYRGFNKEAP